uniref:Gnk2-homologous domain-containing protein n=1 Tax=Fagus sylvatica TaxID=28930 RepID=A0A2N9FUF8_FAGSY
MTYLSLPILLLSMLSVLSLTTAPSYLYHDCPNTTISNNSPNKTSLISSLLSSISLYATRNIEFYSLSSYTSSHSSKIQISVNVSDPDISDPVYGFFLCRGDVTAEVCKDCVAFASNDVVQRCPTKMVAVIWYDECMIRYSDAPFFSTMATDPAVYLVNTQNTTEQERHNQLLNTTMIDLASQASEFPAGAKKFGTKEVNFSQFQTMYNLVQCTPDLSSTDCNTCLQVAIQTLPNCCGGKQGGRVLYPSCYVRYELYPFYQMVDTTPATAPTPRLVLPPPISPGSLGGPKDKSQIPTVTIVAIVAPIAASVVLFFFG